MKKVFLSFLILTSTVLLKAQDYSSLFLANGNTTGAQQNPLNIGNWTNPTSAPQYRFLTSDIGASPLEIRSTRWAGGLILSRDGSSGTSNLMAISGWEGQATAMNLYNQNATVTVSLNTNGTSYFNGGNIGIGTTNTGSFKLAVEGKIGAREVHVTLATTWPDYVFNKEYTRMKLAELENFIKTYNHLPNIPSAQEVKEKGINLGEMNAKLLEKIEELTLYVIELKKENDVIKDDNKKIKEQLQKLENK